MQAGGVAKRQSSEVTELSDSLASITKVRHASALQQTAGVVAPSADAACCFCLQDITNTLSSLPPGSSTPGLLSSLDIAVAEILAGVEVLVSGVLAAVSIM